MVRRSGWLLAATLLVATPRGGAAQALTLDAALRRAESGAYDNRIAAGQRAAAAGQATSALAGILPTARFEGGYMRTTDPLNAFGFQLRQRGVTQASFDPAALNYPPPIGNVGAGVVLELPLLNADAWARRAAGTAGARAAEASERWTRARTRFAVLQAYFGAVLAGEQVVTLDTALRAARAHVRQAESMVRNGLATRSDALLADVKAGEVEAQLAGARNGAELARRRLAVALGAPADTAIELPAALPTSAEARAQAERDDSAGVRQDVAAALLARDAAESDARRTALLYVPRVNAFGRLDWNDPSVPFGGKDAWTVGVMVVWAPFSGAAEIGEGRAAGGRREVARAQAEAAVAQGQLEAARADGDLAVALTRLDIAERGTAQAQEAHRIVSRKYEGGLATVTELFDAAAVDTQARLAFAQARFQVITAAADRRQARGLDPAGATGQ